MTRSASSNGVLDGFIEANAEEIGMILTGVYRCWDCGKKYRVNEPHTWAPCSWCYCHECYAKPRQIGQISYAGMVTILGASE